MRLMLLLGVIWVLLLLAFRERRGNCQVVLVEEERLLRSNREIVSFFVSLSFPFVSFDFGSYLTLAFLVPTEEDDDDDESS